MRLKFVMMASLLFLSGISEPVSAQETPTEKTDSPGSQEVEHSEDNYRRFMELKDQTLQKSTLPTNSYQSGRQKLDELPEESQKHLRNQIREVILTEGQWTPADNGKQYPFVASADAEKNPQLKRQEAEAWGELVGEYHQREAQIYANSGKFDAARAQPQAGAGGSAGQQGSNTGNTGTESGAQNGQQNQGQGEDGQQQSGQAQNKSDQNKNDSYSPSGAASQQDPSSQNTAGTSQNAMEFLMQSGQFAGGSKQGMEQGSEGKSANGQAQTPGQDQAAGQAQSQGQGQDQQEQESLAGMQAQQSNAETGIVTDGAANNAAQLPAIAETESTSGSSQNALQFLTAGDSEGTASQANGLPELPDLNQAGSDDSSEQSPRQQPGVASSVSGQTAVISLGTLSIKDLINAKGVLNEVKDPDAAKNNDG